jgi:D-apionolactonase
MEEKKMISKDTLLFGSAQYVPTHQQLRAGPLSVVLQDGVIRYVKLGETEIVRRVYMALRDQNWNTVPTTFSDWKFDVSQDSFRISFNARNRQVEIDYGWKGSITGDSAGRISYSMTGKALKHFKKRIIGLCALFPIRECAGQSANVIKQNGDRVSTKFPYFISSDQPLPGLDDISEIDFLTSVEQIPVSTKFEGDKFEMEDQRSFTDASYKVYSTWVRSTEPENVMEGEEVTQSISISIGSSVDHKFEFDNSPKPTIVETDWSTSSKLPKIGLGASSCLQALSNRELTLLKKLGISHLRCDLDLTSDGWRMLLGNHCAQAQQLAVGLELAIFVDAECEMELELLKGEVENLQPSIASILIFDKGEFATKPDSVRTAQRLFGGYPSRPTVGGGTDRNYFDLNFVHPLFDPSAMVSYSVNPQVHAFDVSSLVETLEGQSWTMNSAYKIYERNPIVVSPITLKPRFNPDEIVPESTDPKDLPPQVDPRQMSLFGACWTAGSVKALAESNASSVTFYETVGWRGLMETENGSKLPEKFFSKPGMIFPLYHVLCDICEMDGSVVHITKSSRPLLVNAISMTRGNSTRLLLYNLTWQSQEVLLRRIKATKLQIKRLNEETAEEAMFNASEFRESSGTIRNVDGSGEVDLQLLPYEVVRVDYEDLSLKS